VGEQARRPRRQKQVDLPGRFDDAIEFVDPEDRAKRRIANAGEDGRAGERRMAGDEPVPLDAAREPGVEGGEIGRLEDRVAKNQVATRRQVL
jgi:hypothetical protein